MLRPSIRSIYHLNTRCRLPTLEVLHPPPPPPPPVEVNSVFTEFIFCEYTDNAYKSSEVPSKNQEGDWQTPLNSAARREQQSSQKLPVRAD